MAKKSFIPNEIILEIFEHCGDDMKHLATLRRVSKCFNNCAIRHFYHTTRIRSGHGAAIEQMWSLVQAGSAKFIRNLVLPSDCIVPKASSVAPFPMGPRAISLIFGRGSIAPSFSNHHTSTSFSGRITANICQDALEHGAAGQISEDESFLKVIGVASNKSKRLPRSWEMEIVKTAGTFLYAFSYLLSCCHRNLGGLSVEHKSSESCNLELWDRVLMDILPVALDNFKTPCLMKIQLETRFLGNLFYFFDESHTRTLDEGKSGDVTEIDGSEDAMSTTSSDASCYEPETSGFLHSLSILEIRYAEERRPQVPSEMLNNLLEQEPGMNEALATLAERFSDMVSLKVLELHLSIFFIPEPLLEHDQLMYIRELTLTDIHMTNNSLTSTIKLCKEIKTLTLKAVTISGPNFWESSWEENFNEMGRSLLKLTEVTFEGLCYDAELFTSAAPVYYVREIEYFRRPLLSKLDGDYTALSRLLDVIVERRAKLDLPICKRLSCDYRASPAMKPVTSQDFKKIARKAKELLWRDQRLLQHERVHEG